MPGKHDLDGFFRELPPKATTAQEKTDAAARLIREDDAEKRANLTATLRAARLERDANECAALLPAGSEKLRN